MTKSTDPNELRTYAFKLRRNNPGSWSLKAAADTLDECAKRIEKTEAEVEALRKALEALYGVVIDHNRSGARWERELFGRMMQSLADAKQALAARPGEKHE